MLKLRRLPAQGRLASCGLKPPPPLAQLTAGTRVLGGTKLEKTARYDQILHLPTMDDRLALAGGTLGPPPPGIDQRVAGSGRSNLARLPKPAFSHIPLGEHGLQRTRAFPPAP
jgi:hypothetical protein